MGICLLIYNFSPCLPFLPAAKILSARYLMTSIPFLPQRVSIRLNIIPLAYYSLPLIMSYWGKHSSSQMTKFPQYISNNRGWIITKTSGAGLEEVFAAGGVAAIYHH